VARRRPGGGTPNAPLISETPGAKVPQVAGAMRRGDSVARYAASYPLPLRARSGSGIRRHISRARRAGGNRPAGWCINLASVVDVSVWDRVSCPVTLVTPTTAGGNF
jgi:hypothetical protein